MEEKKAHYIRLWKAADEILKQSDNPCDFQKIDGKITCAMSRRSKTFDNPQLCCDGCKHWSVDGCTVMSLECKLGWCYSSASSIHCMNVGDHPTFGKIKALRLEAKAMNVPGGWRKSVDEVFPELR